MATFIIAPELPDGTRASYTDHHPSELFDGVAPWSVRLNTATQLIFTTPTGNRLVLKGDGFVFASGTSDPWTAGTINSVELWNAPLSVQYVSIGGLSASLADFGRRLPYGSDQVLDLLLGSSDTIIGGPGNDRLRGMNGNDSIVGGLGDDNIAPGAGSDTIDGGAGFNSIDYWNYQPIDPASTKGITINLASGFVDDPWGSRDYFKNIQEVSGTSLNDTLIGDGIGNYLSGGHGHDQIYGMGGDDALVPDRGDDVIDGGDGWDTVVYEFAPAGIAVNLQTGVVKDAWNGTDTLLSIERVRSTNFADSIVGSAGDDTFQILGGADTVDGGAGTDTVDYSRDYRWGGNTGVTVNLAANSATDGFGTKDTLINIENVIGTQFADTIIGNAGANMLTGNAGDDNLSGGAGDDTLDGGAGSDILRGGTGNDTVVFSGTKGAYTFTLGADGVVIVSGSETDLVYEAEFFKFADAIYSLDQLFPSPEPQPQPPQPQPPAPPVNIETTTSATLPEGVLNLVAAGSGNISLTGNALDNSITGNVGKNTINGGAGNDKVNGGYGNDFLSGGSGKDTFLFTTKFGTSKTDRKLNFDTINDFKPKEDKLWLDNAIFKKLGKKGSEQNPAKLDKKFFTLGDKAEDRDDYLIYNKKTGVLSYDPDGSGKGQAVEFAILKNKATLKYDDFFVI